jgi:Calcineurin-like phosphoesterase
VIAPEGIGQEAWTCAKLAFELMEARSKGDTVTAQEIEGELSFNVCDVNWAQTIADYVSYFGPDGKRATIPYINATAVGAKTIPLKADATVALIGDWGTGTAVARDMLVEVAKQKPDVVIHLGDIYYSGTPTECDINFKQVIDTVLDRATTRLPVYTLAGNHDMYSGGAGFYGLLQTLNSGDLQQPASFFCLRSADNRWQFIGMDTGLHDYNPFDVTEVLTKLDPDEEKWIIARIGEFAGKTILLSHHQLFSAFAQIGPKNSDDSLNAYNEYLAASFTNFQNAAPGRIAAWFWGHEHNLTVYQPYKNLTKGRCIGHGAVPVFATDAPYTVLPNLVDPPAFVDLRLETDDQVYVHGFTIVRLKGDGTATAEYYEGTDGSTPMLVEDL